MNERPNLNRRQAFLLRAKSRLDQLRQTLQQGTGTVLVIQVGGLAARYISYVLLARWMGAADYGSFIYVFTWVQSLSTLAALGMAGVTLRFMNEYQASQELGLLRGLIRVARLFSLTGGVGLGILGTGLVLALSPGAKADFPQVALLTGMILVPLQALLGIQVEILRGYGRLGLALLPPLVLQASFQALLSGLWYAWHGELTSPQALLALAISFVICLGLQQVIIAIENRRAGIGHIAPAYATKTWGGVAFPMLSSQVSTLIFSQSDILLVGAMLSAGQAGLYAAASKTAALVIFPLTAMNSFGAPMIARYHARRDRTNLQAVVQLTSRWAFIPALVIALAFTLFGQELLGLFGREFTSAGLVLNILVAGQVVNAWTGPVNTMLDLTGHERRRAKAMWIFAAANLVLVLLLSLAYGGSGAALGKTLGIIALNLWLAWLVWKHLRITTPAYLPS